MKWLLVLSLLVGGASMAWADTPVELTWTDPAPDASHAVATGHNIYRSTTAATCSASAPLPGPAHKALTTMSSSYSETVTVAGGKVCYEISATNAGGESGRSNRVSKDLLPNPPMAPTLAIQ